MTVNAVRTLPDGERCESRTAPGGQGWFGLVGQPYAGVRSLPAGEGVTLIVDDAGMVVAVSFEHGRVTDSVLFYVIRSLQLQGAQ